MLKRNALQILTTCAIAFFALSPHAFAEADSGSLAYWFLPESSGDLPHEIDDDFNDYWKEIWTRPGYDSAVQPNLVMEQTLGARWMGSQADKDGKPGHMVLVLAGRRAVEIVGDKAKPGVIEGTNVNWSDKTRESLVEFRRRRHKKHAANIKFGKVPLPPLASKTKQINAWSVEGLDEFLNKMSYATDVTWQPRDYSAIAQIADPNGSLYNFRYGTSCSFKDRQKVETALAGLDTKLTCWMEQNQEAGARLISALMQRPTIECHGEAPMTADHCGMSTPPHNDSFFLVSPKIVLALNRCEDDLSGTLLHEIFHISGIHEVEADLDKAVQDSESCTSSPASLSFENQGEGFMNDFEVQVRMTLFRKVRDEAVNAWGWSDGEKDFMLATLCSKMGDKYCARNYFQKAFDDNPQEMVMLPEGTQISLSSMIAYGLFDSISEDIPRMHELVRYLHKDPNGTLLRRTETGTHRLHEFFVARTALESVQANRGICSGDADDRIMCEDLSEIVKTPWFKNP